MSNPVAKRKPPEDREYVLVTITQDGKTVVEEEKKTFVRIAIETKQILDVLMESELDEGFSYGALAELVEVGVRPHEPGYRYLYSARRIAEREGIHFSTIPGEGIQRISHEDLVMGSSAEINRINRAAKRAATRISRVDFDDLSTEAQQRHNANMTIFNLNMQFTKPSLVKQVEAKVSANSGPLELDETLDMFR